MKITEKQLLMLIRVLEGSLCIVDRNDFAGFGYSRESREQLFVNIMNQQDNELIDIKDKVDKEDIVNIERTDPDK